MTVKDFPAPTLILLGEIQLEVFDAGQQNKGNPIVLCRGWPEHANRSSHQIRTRRT